MTQRATTPTPVHTHLVTRHTSAGTECLLPTGELVATIVPHGAGLWELWQADQFRRPDMPFLWGSSRAAEYAALALSYDRN